MQMDGLRRGVSAAALAFLSALVASSPALADDCCADLEARIAELEETTARKGNRKVSLEIYGLGQPGAASPGTTASEAERLRSVTNVRPAVRASGSRGRRRSIKTGKRGYKIEIGVRRATLQPLGPDDIPPGRRLTTRTMSASTCARHLLVPEGAAPAAKLVGRPQNGMATDQDYSMMPTHADAQPSQYSTSKTRASDAAALVRERAQR